MRELTGVLLKDWWRYAVKMHFGSKNYLTLCNRMEAIAAGPDNLGCVCLWPHTSKLHAPLILPNIGKKLLEICITRSRFDFKTSRLEDDEIVVSVLIGHRGMERLPLLLATLNSVAGQIGVGLECIVIEQDNKSLIKDYLPTWVKYVFMKTKAGLDSYNRSATFNCGVEYAKGSILVLHDNDMLMPSNYCSDIAALVERGYEAVNPKRYIFYLSRAHSERITAIPVTIPIASPEYIIQNLEAGGSMAITRSAFFAIGGMDEEFIGWGGEDVEFWRRCSLLKRWIWGYQPIIHLWHQSQPLKETKDNPNINRTQLLQDHDLKDRISYLKRKNWGGRYYDK